MNERKGCKCMTLQTAAAMSVSRSSHRPGRSLHCGWKCCNNFSLIIEIHRCLSLARVRQTKRHTQPSKPTQNARVKSFHGWLRKEWLNLNCFQNLFDARRKICCVD